MTKIRRVNFGQFRNHDFFHCSTEFIDMVGKFDAAKLKIEELFNNEYRPAFNELDDAIQKIEANTFMEAKNAADHRRDLTTRGMVNTNNAALNHFDEAVVSAAKRLKILFDTYGNITQKSQREQTSATTNLLQELTGRFAKDVEIVRLGEWVKRLEVDNKAYNAIEKSSYAEDAARNNTNVKEARIKVTKIYRQIVDRMEALLLIEGAEIHIDFIKQWNVILEKYAHVIAQRQGIAKSEKDKEDSIDSE